MSLTLSIAHRVLLVNGLISENAACKLVQFIPLFIVMAAIFTIVVIAVDRFRVMLYRKTLYRWKSLVVVGLIWLVSCGISAPQLYEYSVYYKTNEETNRTQKVCGSEGLAEHFETVYAAAVFVLAYCVPLLILLICYTQISVLVWKHGKRFRSTDSEILNNDAATIRNSGQLETRISKRKVKVLKMLIAIAVSFIVLWTPYFILFAVQVMFLSFFQLLLSLSLIVQFIFYFWSFEISVNILRNQK